MGQEAGGEQEPELEACTVRFASARSNVVARVCWVTDNDTEVEYARLWPGVSIRVQCCRCRLPPSAAACGCSTTAAAHRASLVGAVPQLLY